MTFRGFKTISTTLMCDTDPSWPCKESIYFLVPCTQVWSTAELQGKLPFSNWQFSALWFPPLLPSPTPPI